MGEQAVRAVVLPAIGSRRLPFAVGLIQGTATGPLARSRRRVAVALTAHEAGFFLLDVVESPGQGGVGPNEWERLWSLARRTDAEAVVVLGLDSTDRDAIDVMADELRLVVRVTPPEAAGPPDCAGPGLLTNGRPINDRPTTDRPTTESGLASEPTAAGVLAVDRNGPNGGPRSGPWRVRGRTVRSRSSER